MSQNERSACRVAGAKSRDGSRVFTIFHREPFARDLSFLSFLSFSLSFPYFSRLFPFLLTIAQFFNSFHPDIARNSVGYIVGGTREEGRKEGRRREIDI